MNDRRIKHIARFALLALLAMPVVATAQENDSKIRERVDPEEFTKKLDTMYRSETSKARMTMHIVTPNYERTLKMEMTTRGQDDTLIRILSPRKEKGISTLKKGNEMWNYLPKIKKVVRVPPSMMSNSWMGSNVTNDDLVRESSWRNDFTVKQVAAPEGQFCFDYTPTEDAAITWSHVLTCFHAKYQLPVKQEFFDEKGEKVRVMNYDKFKKVDGRAMPTRITIKPLSEEKRGEKTVMTYDAMSFDVPVDDSTFSMANLRRGR